MSIFKVNPPEEKFTTETDFQEIKRNSYWKISGKLRKCYDKDQMALFGSNTHRSSIYYEYISGEYMANGVPYIVSTGINYDGGKEQDKAVAAGALCLSYEELPTVFTDNKFKP